VAQLLRAHRRPKAGTLSNVLPTPWTVRAAAAAATVLVGAFLAACAPERPPPAAATARPAMMATATPAAPSPATTGPTATPGATAAGRVGPPSLGPVAAGERPPQVVVVAFDGGGAITDGAYRMSQFWRDVGRAAGARFTFFLSGPYLLTPDNLARYDAPRLGPATQNMGMEVAGVLGLPGESQEQALRYELEQLRGRFAEGHEIGTHFNGHICGDAPGSVAHFTAADWGHELDQFENLVDHANELNDLHPPVDLGFTSADVVGSRTPCLQGDLRALYPVLAEHGYRYDTSPDGDAAAWPRRGAPGTGPTRLWVFPLATIRVYGTNAFTLAMDYNLCYRHDGCRGGVRHPAAETDRWSQEALDSFRRYFDFRYTGNRAPIYLGNHSEMWHNGAYTDAVAAFVTETCGRPEVRCVTYGELARWLDTVPAEQLAAWREGRFPRLRDADPPPYGRPVPGAPRPERMAGADPG
jgi:hypothetical protein